MDENLCMNWFELIIVFSYIKKIKNKKYKRTLVSSPILTSCLILIFTNEKYFHKKKKKNYLFLCF